MIRPLLVLAFGAGSLLMAGAGCSSSSNPGAPDGGAMTPDAQPEVDAGVDARALCEAVGGACRAFGATCTTVVGPAQACGSDKPGGSFCCAVAPDAGICGAGAIPAASYDQSCATDRDCIAVHEGDFCSLCALNCPNATISVSAQAQYMLDYANTPAGVSAQRAACDGDCTSESGPCCVGGRCQLGGQCFNVVLAGDAGIEAGVYDAASDASADAAPSDGAVADAGGE